VHIHVLTLFPEVFPGPLACSLLKTGLEKKLWSLHVHNLRDYATDARKTVDDKCYGGGRGMVLRADIIDNALRTIVPPLQNPLLIYLSPRGQRLCQKHLFAWATAQAPLILLCGRFEGVDQRVLDAWNFTEISVGDFVLCGGELPAMLLIEGCIRLLPGIVNHPESLQKDSFAQSAPLLEHPHYTRPALWNGLAVPPVLISGHHRDIDHWRAEQSLHITQKNRPDLLDLTHQTPGQSLKNKI
jgi:tRNA (guanine37-N1)-methyltransferase